MSERARASLAREDHAVRRSESRPLITTAFAGPSAVRSRRMLVAVALAGSAALLAACASPGTGPSTAPPQPSASATATGIPGDAPVEIADDLLQAPGLFDEVSAEGFAVRWAEPGESLAVVIGGSGGGGGCIPQPHAAELDESTQGESTQGESTQGESTQGESMQSVVVRFDPPDPAMACTADFRLHGWELGLASPVDAESIITVELVNLQGNDESTEVQIGPDDLLANGPTADPQPSIIPGTPPEGAGEPTPIPAAQLPGAEGDLDPTGTGGDPVVTARWIEPGETLAILLGGSGVEACVPAPVTARSTDLGAIEVTFEAPAGGDCSADFKIYGWSFPLAEPVAATLPVEVTINGLAPDGGAVVLTLQSDQLLEAP